MADSIAANLPEHVKVLLSTQIIKHDNSWWITIPAERRLTIARFLGALHIYGLLGKPLKKASQKVVEHEKEVLIIGAEILLGGEKSFHSLLARIKIQPNSTTSYQLMKEGFPGLLLKMRRQLLPNEFNVLAGYIHSSIQSQSDLDATIVWRGSPNNKLKTAVDSAKCLTIRLERLSDTLSKHGALSKTRMSANGRKMTFVESSTLQKIISETSSALTYRVASRKFGIPASRLTYLIESKLIQKIGDRVDACSIEMLLQRFLVLSDRVQQASSVEYKSFCQLLRTLIPVQHTVHVFENVLHEKIRVRFSGHNCTSLSGFEISKSDLDVILDEIKGSDTGCISIADAAVFLNLKQEVLYHLARQKIIKVTPKKIGRRFANFISTHELERFSSHFEKLVCAAKRIGISKQGALKWAQSGNIKLISGPSVDGGRQYFVEKLVSTHSPM